MRVNLSDTVVQWYRANAGGAFIPKSPGASEGEDQG